MPVPLPPTPDRLLLDGTLVTGEGPALAVDDPATDSVVAELRTASPAQVDAAVAAARRAFDAPSWRNMPPAARGDLLDALATQIAARADDLTRLLVAETGAPITATGAFQVGGAVAYFRWYAQAARRDRTRQLGPRPGATTSSAYVRAVPLGTVAAITAYNYPLLLAANKIGALVAAGCTAVLMPSPQAPLATLLLGELIGAAGFPDGVVNVVVGDAAVGRHLTEHPDIDKVSFTGSTEVGWAIAGQAGSRGKGLVLELGGKAPCILLPGTDLEAVVPGLLLRLFRNAGQGCQVPSRILVEADQLDRFRELARAATDRIVVGDPWDPASQVGPVINAAHRDRVLGFVSEAVEDGGEVMAQGQVPDGPGHWVPPTLVEGVGPDARIVQEEIFGPVGVVLPYGDVDEAVALANDTRYGLAAHIYGPDVAAALALAPRLRSGSVFVNGVGLRPDGPSGGFGDSGVGREQGEEGIAEFLTTQTISWAV